ncbi:hypothetical protein TVAG_257520 [Trichomonas vaginalis G3]|uniref:Uncharacterized protein n=1 Tax=Trichomonas vaginalis (strain ATCC PRA-98 / G3) TaxID=412133 RepID=A2ELI6_TRIV3|nr:RNA polymerase II transcription regulator recruiting protein [Trichomonas vaginalis G3]EAY06513.1 hypothetical protein TVAG_257520 [Trichomonas vaginalis G3]KAI5538851.1 RNA polymerase II transcription regulator recruiting protein [Trichomonas vaginalis G3]|eukprot:XP_001318736.1 hypothetical protein [Trichomonas vaginalis G3]
MEYGSKWTYIANFFPGRTDINLKNRWQKFKNQTTVVKSQEDNILRKENDYGVKAQEENKMRDGSVAALVNPQESEICFYEWLNSPEGAEEFFISNVSK